MTLLVLLAGGDAGAVASVSFLQVLPYLQGDVGLAVETDAALAPTGGDVAEGEVSWLQVLPDLVGEVGLAVETDTALTLESLVSADVSWVQIALQVAGLATEIDTAFALTSGSQPGAQADVSWLQVTAGAIGTPDERVRGTWTPALLTRWQLLGVGVGLANEVDTALALVPEQHRAPGLAVETDTALALTGAVVGIGFVGLATETDSAFALTAYAPGSVGLAREINTAFSLFYVVPTFDREPTALTLHAQRAPVSAFSGPDAEREIALRRPRRDVGRILNG